MNYTVHHPNFKADESFSDLMADAEVLDDLALLSNEEIEKLADLGSAGLPTDCDLWITE